MERGQARRHGYGRGDACQARVDSRYPQNRVGLKQATCVENLQHVVLVREFVRKRERYWAVGDFDEVEAYRQRDKQTRAFGGARRGRDQAKQNRQHQDSDPEPEKRLAPRQLAPTRVERECHERKPRRANQAYDREQSERGTRLDGGSRWMCRLSSSEGGCLGRVALGQHAAALNCCVVRRSSAANVTTSVRARVQISRDQSAAPPAPSYQADRSRSVIDPSSEAV